MPTAYFVGWRLLSIHKRFQREPDKDKVDWGKICEQAGSSNPLCKPWISELAKFVQKGPSNGELLHVLRDAVRTFGWDPSDDSQVNMLGKEFFFLK